MFSLTKPSPRRLDAVLAARRDGVFSYPEVGASRGATRASAPASYMVDHNRAPLGTGSDTFRRAREALSRWTMFDLGWCAIHPRDAPIAEGAAVAAVVRHFGFWSVNVSRVVYLLDEDDGDVRRWGFAYGTTPGHAERGEERFSVEWHRRDDRVWYDLYAFSRPGHPLARLGSPVARMLQRRFARDSMGAMVRALGA
jgi:uncharacterized protein (UPF0548 family)